MINFSSPICKRAIDNIPVNNTLKVKHKFNNLIILQTFIRLFKTNADLDNLLCNGYYIILLILDYNIDRPG